MEMEEVECSELSVVQKAQYYSKYKPIYDRIKALRPGKALVIVISSIDDRDSGMVLKSLREGLAHQLRIRALPKTHCYRIGDDKCALWVAGAEGHNGKESE
jgi:hypothetical protein